MATLFENMGSGEPDRSLQDDMVLYVLGLTMENPLADSEIVETEPTWKTAHKLNVKGQQVEQLERLKHSVTTAKKLVESHGEFGLSVYNIAIDNVFREQDGPAGMHGEHAPREIALRVNAVCKANPLGAYAEKHKVNEHQYYRDPVYQRKVIDGAVEECVGLVC